MPRQHGITPFSSSFLAAWLRLPQELRELSDIRRDPPCFVARQKLAAVLIVDGTRAPARLVLHDLAGAVVLN